MKPYRQYLSGIRDNVSRSLDVHGDSQNNLNFINLNNSYNHSSQINNQYQINLNNSYNHQTSHSQNTSTSNRQKQNLNYGNAGQDRKNNQKKYAANNTNRSFNGTNNRGASINSSFNQSPQYNTNNLSNTISYDSNVNANNGISVVYNNFLNNTISADRDYRKQPNHVRSQSSTNNYNDKQERVKSVYGQRQANSSMENRNPLSSSFNNNDKSFINGTIQAYQQNNKSHSLNQSRGGNRGIDDQINTPNTSASNQISNKINSQTPRDNNMVRKINNSQNKQKRNISPKNNGIQMNNLNNFQIQIPSQINFVSGQNSRNTHTSGQRTSMNSTQRQQIMMKNRQNLRHNYTFTNYLNMGNTKNNSENNNTTNQNNNSSNNIQIQSYNINVNNNIQQRNNSGKKNIQAKSSIQQLILQQIQQQEQDQQRQQNMKNEFKDQNKSKQPRYYIGLNGISYNNQQKAQYEEKQQISQPPKNMQEYLQENSLDNTNYNSFSLKSSNSKENTNPHQQIQQKQLNILTQKRNSFSNQNRSGSQQQRRLKSSQEKYGRGTPNSQNKNMNKKNGVHSSLDSYQSLLESKEKNENTMRRSLNISTIDNQMLEQIRPNFKLTISHRTKQGVLASNPNKTNQDSFIIQQNLLNKSNQHFYAVCDGHGTFGHHVSQFIKQHLPILLQNDWQLLQNNPKAALYNAIGFVNHKLALADIDCMFSGTTLVSVLLQGTKLYSANVGDSRATIGRLGLQGAPSKYVPRPLTRDHKPGLQGEAERIIQAGGRIDTFRDQEGNHLGPLRVWLKNENIPGLAMSRSIGDNLAGSVGVTWEPEIFEFDIDKDDRFMIVASDGVWEFIENEEIVNMIAPFYDNNDIEGACDHVLKESHSRWTVDDDSVIDDITLIIIFFDHQENIKVASRPNSRSSSQQRNSNFLYHSIDNSYIQGNNINNNITINQSINN